MTFFSACSSDDEWDYTNDLSNGLTRTVDDMTEMKLYVYYDSTVTRHYRFIMYDWVQLRDPLTGETCKVNVSWNNQTHIFWGQYASSYLGIRFPAKWKELESGDYWEIEVAVNVLPEWKELESGDYWEIEVAVNVLPENNTGDFEIKLLNLGVETTWQIDETWIAQGVQAGTSHVFKGRLYTDISAPIFELHLKTEKIR